jgi:hypothetical protein
MRMQLGNLVVLSKTAFLDIMSLNMPAKNRVGWRAPEMGDLGINLARHNFLELQKLHQYARASSLTSGGIGAPPQNDSISLTLLLHLNICYFYRRPTD